MGIVAGSATKTGKLGWVIGHPVPNILASINAFQLGAQSVNPGVTTYVTVTNAWLDPPQEQSAVRSLAADGADVLTMIVDSPVTVVRTADELGLKSIGFHCLCLQGVAGNGWLTGVGFEWGGLFTEMARDVMAGTWKSEDKIGGIAEGSARIAPYAAEVSPETRSRVEKAKLALISGELRLFTGPVYDNHGRVVIPEGQSADVAKLIGTTDYLVQGVVGQLK